MVGIRWQVREAKNMWTISQTRALEHVPPSNKVRLGRPVWLPKLGCYLLFLGLVIAHPEYVSFLARS